MMRLQHSEEATAGRSVARPLKPETHIYVAGDARASKHKTSISCWMHTVLWRIDDKEIWQVDHEPKQLIPQSYVLTA